MRFFKYIVLSFFINSFLFAVIDKEANIKTIKPILKPIEINIVALAKPKTKPIVKRIKVKEKVIKKLKPKPKIKKVVVKKRAQKKIAVVKKVKVIPKKIIKKVVKKTTKKKLRVKKIVNSNVGKQVSTLLHKANYKLQTPIIYPNHAIKRRQQGKVVLRVLINKLGKPVKIEIKKSSGYSSLDNAAIKTVKTWEFEPHKQGGLAIESWAEVPVKFKIKT